MYCINFLGCGASLGLAGRIREDPMTGKAVTLGAVGVALRRPSACCERRHRGGREVAVAVAIAVAMLLAVLLCFCCAVLCLFAFACLLVCLLLLATVMGRCYRYCY